MIEVRVRHEYESKPVRLMDWPADRLDEVIPLLSSWSVNCDDLDGDPVNLLNGSFSGQFRYDGVSGYFEVIVHEDD